MNTDQPLKKQYVAYLIRSPQRGTQALFSNVAQVEQEKKILEFIKQKNNGVLLKTFIEISNPGHRHKWSELEAAVSYCLTNKAHLIIGEAKHLITQDNFVKEILKLIHPELVNNFSAQIYCCDQPFINKENFMAIVEHTKQQKMLHGELIKAGLKRTSAKSGNPYASEIINKVNKPKIDSAIIFALLLAPVILHYQQCGFSQRKMVTTLNEEGFTAPEGGHWVLSQLQKVLDRIKMNEIALAVEKKLSEYQEKQFDNATLAELFNKSISAPKGDKWTPNLVEKVIERIKQIHDIMEFNEFTIELMPLIEKYSIDELTQDTFAKELQKSGIIIPESSTSLRSSQ